MNQEMSRLLCAPASLRARMRSETCSRPQASVAPAAGDALGGDLDRARFAVAEHQRLEDGYGGTADAANPGNRGYRSWSLKKGEQSALVTIGLASNGSFPRARRGHGPQHSWRKT